MALDRTAILFVATLSVVSATNVIIFLADNLGYADIGKSTSPHLYSWARKNLWLEHWNSAAHLCSASRAALLTGEYPVRHGIYPSVFHRDAAYGLPPSAETMASILKKNGYKTGIVGKWHLGHRSPYLPTNHGFEEWLGIPYHMSGGSVDGHVCDYDSNSDTWLPLYHNDRIVQQPVRLSELAETYATYAESFLDQHQNDLFFLYVPFSHVHQLCAPRDYSEQGTCQWTMQGPNSTFVSAVQEMDWIAGRILQKLDALSLSNDTIVWFTSDNGPWVAEQKCSGSKGEFRGQWLADHVDPRCTACPHDYLPDKGGELYSCRLGNRTLRGVPCGEDTGLGSLWEANLRMPTIFSWPGVVDPGITKVTTSSLDILPTTLSLLGIQNTRQLDGADITSVLFRNATDYSRVLFFWRDGFDGGPLPAPFGRVDVAAVKVGYLKFWFWTKSGHYNDDRSVFHDPPLIFDVDQDPAESKPLNPELYSKLVHKVKQLVQNHKAHVGQTYPLTLERDVRYTPCVNRQTHCRTSERVTSS